MEAPVSDYQTHGDFSQPSSFGFKDHEIVSSPKAKEKVVRLFAKTPFEFNLHFINLPGGPEHWHDDEEGYTLSRTKKLDKDYGETNPKEIAKAFGVKIEPDPRAITFIMAGNDQGIGMAGRNDQLSPWIIAHRFAHTLWKESVNNGFLQRLTDLFNSLKPFVQHAPKYDYEDATGYSLAQFIMTMKSARTDRLNDVPEELIAQFIITGRISLHRHGSLNAAVGDYSDRGTLTVADPAGFDQQIAKIEQEINELAEKLVSYGVGRMFVI